MKSTKKTQKQNIPETLSMKDALGTFRSFKKVESGEKKLSIRDIVWNYPVYIEKLFKITIPFSYILTFILVGLALGFFFQSKSFGNLFAKSSEKDTFVEGSVGAISSFNPLFVSANYVDKTIESLVFNKFVYIGTDGNVKGGIAKDWTVSSDSLEYAFTIDDSVKWQDGSQLTMDDVLFTFQTAVSLSNNYGYDSVGSALSGVEISQTDESHIKFKLSEVNPTFFEAISIYIVPKAKLEEVSLSDMPFNIFARYPLGSGKYMVTKTEQNAVYLEDNQYDEYEPSIKNIVFRIYPDNASLETAFRIGSLDAIGSWDIQAFDFINEYPGYTQYSKVENYKNKIIFLNMRKDSLKEANVRIGLSYMTDKNQLLSLSGLQGTIMKGPYSESSWAFNSNITYYEYDSAKGAQYLNEAGYTKNESSGYFESADHEILSFTITYFGSDSNDRLVDSIVSLYAKEGIVIKEERLDYSQITQEAIATRDFEMLLYEVETTVDPDQYNLWHSLKTNYPDLNLSGYSYERVDILLEEGRRTTNQTTRKTKYDLFQKYLMSSAPAIFLYHPTFVYYVDDGLKGIDLGKGNFSYDRFSNIVDWYWE